MSFPADPAAARTALAWQRTALSVLAGALLLVRLSEGWSRLLAVGTVLILAPAIAWVVWGARFDARDRHPHPGRYAALAVASTLLGLAVLLLVVTGGVR